MVCCCWRALQKEINIGSSPFSVSKRFLATYQQIASKYGNLKRSGVFRRRSIS